jgi:predicted O-methyltransferase YrrM
MATPDASLALLERPDLTEDRLASLPSKTFTTLDEIWTDRSDPANPKPIKAGHIGRGKAATLHNIVSSVKPVRTLEIGLFRGTSAIVIMAAAQRDGYLGHFAMDPAQSSQAENIGIKNIQKADLAGSFNFFETESCYGLPFLILEKRVTFDFAFIDASHHFDHTLLEFFYIDRLIPPGAIIAFDDIATPAVEAVINYIGLNRHYALRRAGALAFAVKMAHDSRHWFEFNKFEVPETDAFMSRKYATSGKEPRLKQYK